MSASAVDVLVVGDALLDVTARPSGPIRPGADVPADVGIATGGQGANLAVRLARQGVRVELVCGLGDDDAAALIRHALDAEGVRISPVAVPRTGTVVIVLDPSGERTMLSRRADFASLIAVERLPRTSWVVLSGYLLLEADASAFATALAAASARRAIVGCAIPDPALASWRSAVLALQADLLILNRDEANALRTPEDLSSGTVVTGVDVVEARIGDVRMRVPVERSGGPALDTTGAGDAFAATLVAGLLGARWPPPGDRVAVALGAATALAAEVAHVDGAQARVPAEAAATLRR